MASTKMSTNKARNRNRKSDFCTEKRRPLNKTKHWFSRPYRVLKNYTAHPERFSEEPVMPFFGAPGLPELMIVGIIALLLFGKRLPEVARSLGKGIVEFKKGVRGVEDDMDTSVYSSEESSPRPIPEEERDEATAPKFEPPAAEPVAKEEQEA